MEEQLEKEVEYHTPVLVEDLGMRKYGNQNRTFGLYKCYCGNTFEAMPKNIHNKTVQSCGCIRGRKNVTHGLSKDRLYKIWISMLYRCNNPEYKYYHNYGGRGISVCKTWQKDFNKFKEWSLANGYADDLSIDRINNSGNYKPSNCRWTTATVQSRNTRLLISTNTSGYRGVCWNKRDEKWRARIRVNYKYIHLGCFDTAEEGAIAYNNYVIENNLEHPLNIIKISEKNNSEKTYYKSKYY